MTLRTIAVLAIAALMAVSCGKKQPKMGGPVTQRVAVCSATSPSTCWSPTVDEEILATLESGTQAGLNHIGSVGTETYQATSVDASDTIDVGGTFQTLIAQDATRLTWRVQNICDQASACTATTNLCWVYAHATGTPTTANSIPIYPGGYLDVHEGVVTTSPIVVTCTGTGDKIVAGMVQ